MFTRLLVTCVVGAGLGCTERINTSGWRNGPIAVNDDAFTPPRFTVTIPVLDNDWDPDGDALSIVGVTNAEHGEVNHDGVTVSYTPAIDFLGEDVFVYTVADTAGFWAMARVRVNVFLPTNRGPTAIDDSAATDEDTTISLDVLANDTDPDFWDTLSIASVAIPTSGVAVTDGETITYTAADEFDGVDTFTYVLSDGRDGIDTATVTVVVTGVDDPPVATPQATVTTNENTPVDITLTGTDPEDPVWALVVDVTTPPVGGSVNITVGLAPLVLRYTPAPGFSGLDSFGFTVTDTAEQVSAEEVVTVEVLGANDLPVANDDGAAVVQGGEIVIDVLNNDTDPDLDTLVVTGTSTPANGSASFTAADVTYTPDPAFSGQDVFTYDISDGRGGTDSASVTVTVFEGAMPPLYPGAANWNDYVLNDGTTIFNASDSSCPGTGVGGYGACLHGGELRAIPVPGHSTCGLLAATDALGAFEWVCDGSTDPVRMVSVGLRAGKSLFHLLDTSELAFLPNSIRVSNGGPIVFETPPSLWWSNPVVATAGGSLNAAGTVYVLSGDASAPLSIAADRVALVAVRAIIVAGPGGTSLVSASPVSHAWIEGSFNGSGYATTMELTGVTASVLTDARVANGSAAQLRLLGQSRGNLVRNVASLGGTYGVEVEATSIENRVESSRVSKASTAGLFVAGDDNTVAMVMVGGGGAGVIVSGSGNVLEAVTVSNNSGDGVVLAGSDNRAIGVVTVSSGTHGLSSTGTDNQIWGATSADNGGSGFRFEGAGTFATHLAASNNGGGGLHALTGVNQTFANLSLGSNGTFGFGAQAPGAHITGVLTLRDSEVAGININDCPDLGEANPGITWSGSECVPAGTSDFTMSTYYALGSAFLGKATGDAVNPTDATGLASYHPDLDWVAFESRFRGWGIEGMTTADPLVRGACLSGGCRIWDWRVKASSADLAIGNTYYPGALTTACPTGDQVMVHTWSGGGTNTILLNARELTGDGIGNDDLICETNEHCQVLGRRNAHQGDGALVTDNCFVNGAAVSGVQMWRRSP